MYSLSINSSKMSLFSMQNFRCLHSIVDLVKLTIIFEIRNIRTMVESGTTSFTGKIKGECVCIFESDGYEREQVFSSLGVRDLRQYPILIRVDW